MALGMDFKTVTDSPLADMWVLSALNDKGHSLRYKDPEKAVSLAHKAARQAKHFGYTQERLRALVIEAQSYLILGKNYHAAQAALTQALALCPKTNKRQQISLLLALADSHNALNQANKALKILKQVLGNEQLCAKEQKAKALRLMGQAFIAEGNFARAVSYLLKALKQCEALGYEALDKFFATQKHEEKAIVFRSIAIAYSHLGNYEQAIAYYKIAFPIFESHGSSLAARTLYNIGIAYQQLERLDDAMHYYKRSAYAYEAQHNRVGVAISKIGIGTINTEKGAYNAAEKNLLHAIGILENNKDYSAFYEDALRELATLKLKTCHYDEALEKFKQLLVLFEESQRPMVHVALLHEDFYKAYKAKNDYPNALKHHELYHELMSSYEEQEQAENINQLMIKFDTQKTQADKEALKIKSDTLEREVKIRKEMQLELAKAKVLLQKKNLELQELSHQDSLTKLNNRRYLNYSLSEHFDKAKTSSSFLSVVMLDIDNFKQVNDRFSHAVGDEVLRVVAILMQKHSRDRDITARFGGEEFVVLLPQTDLNAAKLIAESIRSAIETYDWAVVHTELRITASLGLASLRKHSNPEALLAEADDNLYKAKRTGKNKVFY